MSDDELSALKQDAEKARIMRVAQAIAVEAVIGLFLRHGRVKEEKFIEWIATVTDKVPLETPNAAIIATRAKWLAKRMTQEPAPARLKDYLW